MWGTQGWNQWALQPAMFNDVPHEQIDWAALAKQWIQMQQSPTDGPSAAPPPVTMNAPVPAPAPVIMPPSHIPMLPPEENNVPLLKTPVPPGGLQEPFPPERHFEGEPGPFLPKTVDNSFWNKPQWEPSAVGDVDDRVWPAPVVEPAPPLLAGGKETFDYGHMHDNPPLAMQSIDYNHMSDFPPYNQCLIDFRYPKKERKKEKILNTKKMKPLQVPSYPPESQYDQYWSQVNAAPTISPIFLKKERSNANLPIEEDTSQIDAAKRKQLPAWIRDGLEKMEQERLKRLEKERAAKEKAENLAKTESLKKDMNPDDSSILLPSKSKFESDSEAEGDEDNDTYADVKPLPVPKRVPSPVEDTRTEEEKKQDMMLKVRRMLTEILLSVTNAEIRTIAQEVYRKAVSKAPARQLASTASLTSVATGLYGLTSYGTESEASEEEEEENEASDSDGELYRKMKEKKKLFALKEKKIIAELERQELDERSEHGKIRNEKCEPNSTDIEKNAKPIPDPEVLPETKFETKSDVIPFLEASAELAKDEIPFIKNDSSEVNNDAKNSKEADSKASAKSKHSKAEGSHTSDSSSSSSETGTGSDESGKKKHRSSRESRSRKSKKRSKSPSKQSSRHRRGRSKDSDSPDKSKKSSHDEKSRSSSKKKKKYKRSESSSSSSSTTRKHKHRSKYESNRSHRERRSRSYDDRDRKSRRSNSSSRTYHKSDSYSSKSSKYGDGDKYDRRHKDERKHKERKRTPSPHHHSSKLPKKYRSSRSPSSESEYYNKKSKKSRNR